MCFMSNCGQPIFFLKHFNFSFMSNSVYVQNIYIDFARNLIKHFNLYILLLLFLLLVFVTSESVLLGLCFSFLLFVNSFPFYLVPAFLFASLVTKSICRIHFCPLLHMSIMFSIIFPPSFSSALRLEYLYPVFYMAARFM